MVILSHSTSAIFLTQQQITGAQGKLMETKPGSWERMPVSLWGYVAILAARLPIPPSPSAILLCQPQMAAPAPTQHVLSVPELAITKGLVLVSFRLTHPRWPGSAANA